VARDCEAHARGSEGELPVSEPRPQGARVRLHALALVRGSRVLCGQRRTRGLFGGMWEPLLLGTRAECNRIARTLGAPALRSCGEFERFCYAYFSAK